MFLYLTDVRGSTVFEYSHIFEKIQIRNWIVSNDFALAIFSYESMIFCILKLSSIHFYTFLELSSLSLAIEIGLKWKSKNKTLMTNSLNWYNSLTLFNIRTIVFKTIRKRYFDAKSFNLISAASDLLKFWLSKSFVNVVSIILGSYISILINRKQCLGFFNS